MKNKFTLIAAFVLCIVFQVSAQISQRDQAIKYYLDGNNIEAILALEKIVKQKQYSSDADAVNYLGLAYQNALEDKKARKMFEKAVKLQPANANYRANLSYAYLLIRQLNKSQQEAKKSLQIDPSNTSALFVMGTADLWEGDLKSAFTTSDKMLIADPAFPLGYILKSDVLIAALGNEVSAGAKIKEKISFLKQAVDVLELGMQKCQSLPNRKGMEEKLEGVRVFYEHYSKDKSVDSAVPTVPEPGVTPVKILAKPRATYTERARSAGVQGAIRLAVLLGANGKILYILKLKGLGYGLDENAIGAARQITFVPKMKNGVPVSTVVTLEYGFSIY